jgi:hypothetical protein
MAGVFASQLISAVPQQSSAGLNLNASTSTQQLINGSGQQAAKPSLNK